MAEGLSLVDFLADLRRDLVLARERGVDDAVGSLAAGRAALWLEVGEVTVTLEVAHTDTVSGGMSTEAGGKFWVFGSAKVAGTVTGETSRTGTQTLALTLKPRFDRIVKDDHGQTTIASSRVAVEDDLADGEQPTPQPWSEQ